MEVSLCKADLQDAQSLHELQVRAFMPLLEKYQDYETSPANESAERMVERLNQSFSDYYIIKYSGVAVGGIRIVAKEDRHYRVSAIYILTEYQGKGIAQQVFAQIEGIYADAEVWELDTIVQEERNCYLYEKLGYRKTGETKVINDKMTLCFMEKNV